MRRTRPDGADQLSERILEQRIGRGGLPPRGGQGGLGRVRCLGQPGSPGRLLKLGELFLCQAQAHGARSRVVLAGPAP